MAAHDSSTVDLGLPDVAFVVLALLSVALAVVAQLLWILGFDMTGLDAFAPDVVFTVVGPAVSVALVPTAIAAVRYSRRTAAAVGAGVLAAALAVAAFTVRFYALCGPGC